MSAQWRLLGAATVAAIFACAPSAPSQAQPADAKLGATVEGLLAAGRQLSPALRAMALETEAAIAKVAAAGALDDPTISNSYQYYKDGGVFSAHTVMLSQSFPLWGKRDLRQQAALADVAASRGREQATRDDLDEKIKVAHAQYFMITGSLIVNREIIGLARRMQAATAARYGQGGSDQVAAIQAIGEETAAKIEAVRLEGNRAAIRARLNTLVGRSADALLAEPIRVRPLPIATPGVGALVDRARGANPTLTASTAAISAARSRSDLADKAWYPDVTVGAGPVIQTNNRSLGFAAAVGLNIPVPWGRAASGQLEAAAQLSATQLRYDAARLEIEGALGEVVARLHAARATEALLRKEAAPQARATVQSLLANYGQGRGDLAAVVNAERQLREVALRLLAAQFNGQVELAAIERLIGGDL